MDMQHVKTQIAQIIDQRRPMVKRIEQIEAQMNELSSLLTETDRYRQQTAEKLTPEQNDRLGSLHGAEIIRETSVIRQELQQLKARFSRNTLNIGVVGLARQGKSRLLQSLTGLTKAEIPDSSGGHCTGVRSAILHKSETTPYADVFFYTETEFFQQVIKPYFDELNLGSAPVTLEQFAAFDLSSSPQGAEIGEKYRHLKKYHDHLDLYRSFLFEPSPRRIQRPQIPEFVAQYALDEPETFYCNYLAVREVHIYCPFPNESVGQIAVVDMPGLGDTGIGDEKRLIHSLGQDVDLVLFVRMPKAAGDDWMSFDVQLYDTANQALREIPIEQWSFQVLNRLSDDSNAANCQRFSRSMPAQMKVTNVFIADCADSNQANNLILVPMLEYMASQITELDQRFALSKQAHLDKLRQDVRRFLDEANNALGIKGKAMDGSDFNLFRPLMNKFWTKMTTQINRLTRELKEESERGRDENFSRGLTLAIQRAKENSGIPNPDEISSLADEKGGFAPAYEYLLDVIRTQLTSHFQGLDANLGATVESAKNRIVAVLRDAGLANLSSATDSQFLHDITQLMEENPAVKTLYNGFNDLSSFKLVYRGFVQHRIRRHLSCLMPDDLDARDFETNAKGVFDKLNLLHKQALSNIQDSLEELCWEPSMAVFAVIEEFKDRILRAEEVQRNDWEYFMEEHRSEIWPEKFGWRALLKKLDSLIGLKNFNLLASL
jgi:hypothetical protein